MADKFAEHLADRAGVKPGERVVFFKFEDEGSGGPMGPVLEYASREDFVERKNEVDHGWQFLAWAEELVKQTGAKLVTF